MPRAHPGTGVKVEQEVPEPMPDLALVESLCADDDGRRALVHSALVRRSLAAATTVREMLPFVVSLVDALPRTPRFHSSDLTGDGEQGELDAVWDVFYSRMSGIEEYGSRSGCETLALASDQLDSISLDLDWNAIRSALGSKAAEWKALILADECR